MSDYIPDLTERYPEGFRSCCDKEVDEMSNRVGECILADDQRTWLDDYPKHYWISCFDLHSGMQCGDTIGAHDVSEMLDFFHKRNPDCELNDYGCYEEMED